MLYDTIDVNKIKLGKEKKFSNEDNKTITSIFYDGNSFDFSLKNKFVNLNGIETSIYQKENLIIKSLEYSKIVEQVAEKVGADSPVFTNGTFRATVNKNTNIKDKDIEELRNVNFDACVSLTFGTIFKDENKTTLQIYVKDIVVTKMYSNDLEVDFDKLKVAM